MKYRGVKVGEPIWEAKQKCPDGVYVKRDFRWYETLSRKMLDAVNPFAPGSNTIRLMSFSGKRIRIAATAINRPPSEFATTSNARPACP